ncbi:MAG: MBL fold metallo-hydrolase [Muribaculaceae bacterium]|jgi:glyoxylase-like metal-dependent hydrolase (beta-lactamase superfamily II)
MKIAIFQFSLFGINTYVVYDPETLKCAVIDPGMINREEEMAMDRFIEKNNLTVTDIINTHLHIDHAVGNSYLQKKYGVPVRAHILDQPLGERIIQQAEMFGVDEKVKNVDISSFLNAGDIIKIGNGELKVLHVPGHSQGSVALYDEKDGFVVVGDALFQGSIGRTDLPGGNYNQLINSINSELMALPASTVVYSGHGPATTIGDEKRMNPFLR